MRHLNVTYKGAPFRLYAYDPGEMISDQLERTGQVFEHDLLAWLEPYIEPTFHIVDIGANIGNHAVVFSHLVPRGKVTAIEPQPDNFKMLCLNTDEVPNITAVQKAIGTWSVTAVMTVLDHTNAGTFRAAPLGIEANEMQGALVDYARLDEVVQGKVDLIKIDVETTELDVLKASYPVLRNDRPLIWMEHGYPVHQIQAWHWLRGLGYELIDACEDGNPMYLYRHGEA